MQLSDILQSKQVKNIGAFLQKDISIKNQTPEYLTTISIDPERSVFHFYSELGEDATEIKHYIKGYTSNQFNDIFFEEFKGAIAEFIANMPADTVRKVSVVLPDSAVLTDTFKIPTLKGFGQTSKTLESTLAGLYRNYKELYVASQVLDQNKTFTTFGIVAVKASIVSSIHAACLANRLSVTAVTYTSNALISGAAMINPKLKNASYLMMDIKGVYTRFTFVVKGKTAGFYTVPFGREFLRKPKITQEDMLFDHTYAELMVLTAREAAKNKKRADAEAQEALADLDDEEDDWEAEFNASLNAAAEEVAEVIEAAEAVEAIEADEYAPEQEEDVTEEISAAEPTGVVNEVEVEEGFNAVQLDPSLLARKAPRQLPSFMLRPVPTTREGIAYENFRVLMKWALTLIAENEKITSAGKPEFICVNIPRDLMHVIDTANAEKEENKIAFIPMPRDGKSASILANLELYAGFYPRQILPFGKF